MQIYLPKPLSMPDRHLYEYAVIRLVPRVEREEFVNIGILLFCKSRRFLRIKYTLDHPKIQCIASDMDLSEVARQLRTFERIANGEKNSGTIAALDVPSRFRWLTATRSTLLQTSKVHPGFCENLEVRVEKLFAELVV